MILIESKGFYIDKYYITPFCLKNGELLVIDINKDIPFYRFELLLANMLLEKKNDENILINSPFLFTGRNWRESWLKSTFNPTTIKKYIRRYTSDCKNIIETINNLDSNFLELKDLRGEERMSSLEATPFRLISILTVLTKSKYIFTDMIGQDSDGIKLTWDIINENIENGCCCIILDHFAHSNYTKYAKRFIKIEV